MTVDVLSHDDIMPLVDMLLTDATSEQMGKYMMSLLEKMGYKRTINGYDYILRPCPFCKRIDEVYIGEADAEVYGENFWMIGCNREKCGYSLMSDITKDYTLEQFVAMWNRGSENYAAS